MVLKDLQVLEELESPLLSVVLNVPPFRMPSVSSALTAAPTPQPQQPHLSGWNSLNLIRLAAQWGAISYLPA